MHDGIPYDRNQGQRQGHSREVDRQSPTGLIFFLYFPQVVCCALLVSHKDDDDDDAVRCERTFSGRFSPLSAPLTFSGEKSTVSRPTIMSHASSKVHPGQQCKKRRRYL